MNRTTPVVAADAGTVFRCLLVVIGPARLHFSFDCHMKRELIAPPEIAGDENATEMVRAWIAHNQLHVSMLLGAWDDSQDEPEAWGELLADLTRHIANGVMKEYGWDYDSTRDRIKGAFLKNFDEKVGGIEGNFTG